MRHSRAIKLDESTESHTFSSSAPGPSALPTERPYPNHVLGLLDLLSLPGGCSAHSCTGLQHRNPIPALRKERDRRSGEEGLS